MIIRAFTPESFAVAWEMGLRLMANRPAMAQIVEGIAGPDLEDESFPAIIGLPAHVPDFVRTEARRAAERGNPKDRFGRQTMVIEFYGDNSLEAAECGLWPGEGL